MHFTINDLKDLAAAAREAGNLEAALKLDDEAEDMGMHPDERVTCHPCQAWFDHAHHPRNGARITLEEYRAIQALRGY